MNHKPSDIKNKNVSPHSSGGWLSKVKVMAETLTPKTPGEGPSLPLPASVASTCSLTTNRQHFRLGLHPFSASIVTWWSVSLCVSVCLYFSFCKIFHHIEFRAQLVPLWLNLNLIKCIFNGPVSKSDQSYSGELGVRTLMYLVGGTVHLEQQVARKVLLCAECCSESWRTSRQHWGRRACTWWTLCELKE